MKKKATLFLLLAAAALLVAAAVIVVVMMPPKEEPKPPVDDLVLDTMQIVLPAETTALEQSAATELQTYVKRMSGTDLEIVTEGSAEIASGIYIGATEFASTNEVTYPDNEFGEGWAIKAVGKNLILTGSENRGPLYAVYHLLEDSLGVRWWNYWEESVPLLDEARVPGDYDESGVPAMAYRDVYGGPVAFWEDNLFCVRNRLNGDSSNAPLEYGGEEYFGKPAHVHTFNRYFSKADFDAHPEWFAYYNGARISYGQLCLSNEELVLEFTNRVLKSISESYAVADAEGKKRPILFDVSANDLPEFCSCDSCYASQQEHGKSGDLLIFVNKIAQGVAQYFPEVYIETLAYWQYVDAPLDDTKPAENVIIRLADTDMDVLHGLNHFNNEKTLERFQAWTELCSENQLYIWDYIVFYGNAGLAPTAYKFPENFKIMADMGINGYFGEQERCIGTDMWDMKFWMLAKLCEDPYQDADTLINDFVYGYYGEAGTYVRQYLDLVSAKAAESSAYWTFGANTLSPRWLTVEDVVASDDYFKQAFAAAEGNDTLLMRLRLARNALDRVVFTNFEDYVEKAQEQGVAFNLDQKEICQRIVDCLTEQVEMRGEYDAEGAAMLDEYKLQLANLG